MTTQSKHFETFGENTERQRYIPPFGLIGISPGEVLNQADTHEFRTRQDAFIKQGDKIVAFVDSLSGISRTSSDDAYNRTLPANATVADHLAVSEGKITNFLRGKNVMDLVDTGTYIGPYVVCVVDGATRSLVDTVRLAIYLRHQPEER